MQTCLLPNMQQDGWSALMAGSRNGNLAAVVELLKAGAQPNLEDEVNLMQIIRIQAISRDTYN